MADQHMTRMAMGNLEGHARELPSLMERVEWALGPDAAELKELKFESMRTVKTAVALLTANKAMNRVAGPSEDNDERPVVERFHHELTQLEMEGSWEPRGRRMNNGPLKAIYRVYDALHAEGKSEDDQDIVVEPTGMSAARLECPLTGSLLEDPVENQYCGHVYTKNAILSLLQRSRHVSCPAIGCNAGVERASLRPAKEIAKELKRYQARTHATQEEDGDEETDEDVEELQLPPRAVGVSADTRHCEAACYGSHAIALLRELS